MKPGGKQNTVGNQYNNLLKTINRFLPLEDEYDRESTLQDDFRLEKGQFRNPLQMRQDTINRQNYKSNVVVNRYQENDNRQWQQERVPGNTSYRDAVKYSKKRFTIYTSMVKGLRMNYRTALQIHLLWSLPGTKIKQLSYNGVS